MECKAVFTTIESVDLSKAISVNYNKQLKPFSRDKLFISIFNSCKHLNSPEKYATDLTDTVLSKLLPHISNAEIDRQSLIQTTANVLKNFDKAAYVQYGAYHPVKK